MAEPAVAPVRTAFAEAADWYVALVGSVGDDQWDQPGLGVWSVRELAAHGSRAFTTIETYLQPGAEVTITSAAEYFRIGLSAAGIHDSVAQRGRDEVALLGADLPGAIAERAAAAQALVEATPGDTTCASFVGGMTLDVYLVTRVLELTVHGVDLALAVSATPPLDQPPPSAAGCTLAVLAELAAGRDDRAAAIAALTGRGPLPAAYTALG